MVLELKELSVCVSGGAQVIQQRNMFRNFTPIQNPPKYPGDHRCFCSPFDLFSSTLQLIPGAQDHHPTYQDTPESSQKTQIDGPK